MNSAKGRKLTQDLFAGRSAPFAFWHQRGLYFVVTTALGPVPAVTVAVAMGVNAPHAPMMYCETLALTAFATLNELT